MNDDFSPAMSNIDYKQPCRGDFEVIFLKDGF